MSGIVCGFLAMNAVFGAGADRPTSNPKATRSAVMGTRGVVATSHPLAAQAGIEILRQGGNAIDAAVATNAVLGVVEPMSCGIGGDLFAIVWDAESQRLYGLNASGRSPFSLSRDAVRAQGHDRIPGSGPLSWSVPGCVDGWAELIERFGSKSLADVLAPAIGYAEDGFPVTEVIGTGWFVSYPLLVRYPGTASAFLREGVAPRIGQRMTNRDLAETYRRIAKDGRDAFYRGAIAKQIVDYSKEAGGFFEMRDFEKHTSTWVEPVSTEYRGHVVWELPPNGQGIAALEILNLLEPYDVRAMGHNSAEFLHLFIEAKKLAFADRAKFYADPDVEKNLPIAELISKEYAKRQSERIDPSKAATEVPAGDPRLSHGDTVYLTTADAEGNVVSFIQSIYSGWGSGHVPGKTGFMLQNRGALFAMDEDHHNRLEPHKRPFHTIIPAMVTKNGKPWLSMGVMGGDMQPQGHVQVLANMIDHGMNVQEAGEAARVRHFGSSSPTGSIMKDGGYVAVESGVPDEVVESLRKKGHVVRRGKTGSFGGYQAIRIDHEEGILMGGSDPRKDGCAIAY